jgi:hypothetical protein
VAEGPRMSDDPRCPSAGLGRGSLSMDAAAELMRKPVDA